MAYHGGTPIITYGPTFFKWMHQYLIMIEYYTYAGTNLQGDPNSVLLDGAHCSDLDKKEFSCFSISIFS